MNGQINMMGSIRHYVRSDGRSDELWRYRPQTISATDEISHRPHQPQPNYIGHKQSIPRNVVCLLRKWFDRDMDNSFSSFFSICNSYIVLCCNVY